MAIRNPVEKGTVADQEGRMFNYAAPTFNKASHLLSAELFNSWCWGNHSSCSGPKSSHQTRYWIPQPGCLSSIMASTTCSLNPSLVKTSVGSGAVWEENKEGSLAGAGDSSEPWKVGKILGELGK